MCFKHLLTTSLPACKRLSHVKDPRFSCINHLYLKSWQFFNDMTYSKINVRIPCTRRKFFPFDLNIFFFFWGVWGCGGWGWGKTSFFHFLLKYIFPCHCLPISFCSMFLRTGCGGVGVSWLHPTYIRNKLRHAWYLQTIVDPMPRLNTVRIKFIHLWKKRKILIYYGWLSIKILILFLIDNLRVWSPFVHS